MSDVIHHVLKKFKLVVNPLSLPRSGGDDALVLAVVNAVEQSQNCINSEVERLGLPFAPTGDVTINERKANPANDLLVLVAIREAYLAWLKCHAGLTEKDFK